ncbi:class I SAM-dependent methyltransferase [Polaribacter sp. Q13]|uniref:class I SAM-dependent methyltransferase n=1 Tax=Polaribacter sp. Q13 TaxID=2806551 RepID=UPI00193B35C3|nr:class I SAM-dependent methyltransferase [Polaribacter sp. Q13]QVY65908.1 class I SAM-dependent methyltransferase [Polaribacter sp. Q13]
MDKKTKKPWPTKDAMDQVYKMNLWGSNNSEFYSGSGSHQPEIIAPYIETISSFLTSFKNPITVLDLGCGDFNIGKNFVKYTDNYVAVDIVSELIKYNQENFKTDNLKFECLDIAVDDLPKADCVILRQVLQHLSNTEVQRVTQKLANYKYVILTEHIPAGSFIPNKDIISGQGIRIKKQSGIDLLTTPFHLKIKEEKELLTYTLEDGKGIIVTTLYTIF